MYLMWFQGHLNRVLVSRGGSSTVRSDISPSEQPYIQFPHLVQYQFLSRWLFHRCWRVNVDSGIA